MPPRVNHPDRSPDPDGGHDLTALFQTLLTSTEAIQRAVEKQSDDTAAQLHLQQTMLTGPGREEAGGAAGLIAQYRPQIRADVLKGLARRGGLPSDPTMGMTKTTGMSALTSLQSLQAYTAQRIGERIASVNAPEGWQGLYPAEDEGHGATPASQVKTTPATPSPPPAGPARQMLRAQAQPQPQPPSGPAPGGSLAPIGQAIAQGAAGVFQAGRNWVAGLTTTPAAPTEAPAEREAAEAAEETAQAAQGIEAALRGAAPAAGAGAALIPPARIAGMPGGPGGPPGGGGGAGGGGAPGGGTPMGMWQNIGARVAMSGGTPGGVLGMLKHIPGVGLAVDIADKGAEFYTGQREAGRVYQETEGGTNLGAQTERAHAFAYEASMFGRVPEGVAGQMFGDVTGMGFTQRAVGQGQQLQNRQSALNFMYHQYTATGTDPQQAAEILSTASQSALISLKSVSDAMTTLSDDAGKAGTNAKNARDNYNNLLNTAIQVGAAGGAPQLAGAFATQQAQMGNAFAGTNMSGQMGPREQYMLAGQTGATPAQIQYMERAQPGEYARLVTGSQAQFINQLPGMTPAMMSDLQSMIAAAGGAAQIKTQPALAQDVATQFLNKYQASTPGMDLNVWAQFLSQVSGVPLTPGNVMQWVVTQVAGITPAASASVGAAGGAAGGGQGGTGAAVSAATAGTSNAGGAATGQYGLAQATSAHPGQGARGGETASPGQTWQQVLAGGDQGAAAKTYLGAESKSGKRSPVLEALLQNVPKDAQVAVKTSAGTRVMSFADAMKYYPDEMESGNVQFYNKSGQNMGTTGTITQGLVDPSVSTKSEEAQKGAAAKAGVSLSQYQKQHGRTGTAQGADAGGGVTVDLTNEAKQLLKLLPANSDNAAAAATAPQNPYNASPSR